MKKKIIIIGAGLGGLSAGCRLAAAGHTVEILERRAAIGGLAASMRIGDYAIDTGPSAVPSPEAVESIFQAARKPLPESLQWLPIAPAYRVFDHNMRSFNFKFDAQFLIEEVQRWDANEVAACNEYLKNIRPFFSPKFQDRSNQPFLSPFSLFKTLPAMIRLNGTRSAYRFVSQYFNDPFLRAVLSLKPFLMGSNPMDVNIYTALHMQLQDTAMMVPAGGTGTILTHLTELFKELGGRIHLNAEVAEILTQRHQVSGVRMQDGGLRPADIVISNANVADTYERFLKQTVARRATKQANQQKFSASVFAIYLITSQRYLDTPLAHHNVILPPDFPGLIDDIFQRGVVSEKPAIILHMPTRTDNTLQVENQEILVRSMSPFLTWQPMSIGQPKPALCVSVSLHSWKETCCLNCAPASSSKTCLLPKIFKRISMLLTAHLSPCKPPLYKAAWFRPHNRSNQIKNLYLVGAGTHPGPGISAVLSSAEIVEKLIGPA